MNVVIVVAAWRCPEAVWSGCHSLTGNTRGEVRCAVSLDDCLVEHGKGGLRGEGTAKGGASLRVGALPEPVFTDSPRGAAKGKDEHSLVLRL